MEILKLKINIMWAVLYMYMCMGMGVCVRVRVCVCVCIHTNTIMVKTSHEKIYQELIGMSGKTASHFAIQINWNQYHHKM